MDYRDVTFVAVVLTACWLAAACSSTGGGGPAVPDPLRDHVAAAHEHARSAVEIVTGTRPEHRPTEVRLVDGAQCSPGWCAVEPTTGKLNQGWYDGQRITIAAPPGRAWTPGEWEQCLDVVTHEIGHVYAAWDHDPRYDRFFPGWRDARMQTGRRLPAGEIDGGGSICGTEHLHAARGDRP